MEALCMGAGVNGLMGPTITVQDRPTTSLSGPAQFSAVPGKSTATKNAISSDKTPSYSAKLGALKYPFRSLFLGTKRISHHNNNKNSNDVKNSKGVALDDAVLMEEEEEKGSVSISEEREGQNGNWVLKILHVRSLWEKEKEERGSGEGQNGHLDHPSTSSSCEDHDDDDDDDDGCNVCDDDDENNNKKKNDGEYEFDSKTFGKLLKKVTLGEAKLYAKLSYLGNLAYDIPHIKPKNLLKRHGLRYVTSSIEKRELLAEAEKKEQLANAEANKESPAAESKDSSQVEAEEHVDQKSDVRASKAFQVAASAASFLHSRTRAMLPSRSSKVEEDHDKLHVRSGCSDINAEMASLMATTDSVTAVVAAKEEVKQAVADDLNSISSSPCEWFTCDDDKSATRFFVIQGSETLASWQANLLFEPIQFEDLDVFVHRGIYEAAKGMYQQMLPEVLAHLKSYRSRAKFRFTGHSLGGSLSLLINLMLLIRGEVPLSALLPVVTYGSPCVMCGGDGLLRKLGLPKHHVQAIVMHRDIVPRAFSCNYPRPAAELLKAVNGSFRNHPCLNNQKLLYAPMGEMLILQPDPKFSPQHDLLPSGSGLYLLSCKTEDVREAEKQLRAAKNTFLNTPHPLEILSDRSAYGSGGTIQRDHDMNSYMKCVRGVIRQELSRIRKEERERRRKVWWPLLRSRVVETGVVVGNTLAPSTGGPGQFNFTGVLNAGGESLKRFSRLVASQHMHLLVVVLFPVRLLLVGAYSVIVR